MEKQKLHPSGMTWQRWEWPFKTPQERKLVAQYFKEQHRNEKREQLDNLKSAPF